jgi:quinol-cytochrome oxidoreductase complex cytochrome b subunit
MMLRVLIRRHLSSGVDGNDRKEDGGKVKLHTIPQANFFPAPDLIGFSQFVLRESLLLLRLPPHPISHLCAINVDYSIFIGAFGILDMDPFAGVMGFTASTRCSGVNTFEAAETE